MRALRNIWALVMLALLRQLAARTESSISLTLMLALNIEGDLATLMKPYRRVFF